MGIDALRRAPIGRLVPITGTDGRAGQHYEYLAYLADPLPESVELSSETWTLVAGAEAALARLDQVARQVPSPELLRCPAIRREAQSMSALEGTFAPLKQCSNQTLRTAPISPLPSSRFLNYVEAAEHAFKWVEDRPLTSNLFGELQRTLVRGTAGEHRDADGLRERQVFIGPQDAPIRDARFLPAPPGDQLRIAFDAWIQWVNRGDLILPYVVQAGLAHYQFETLHPDSDGNGRIGRLATSCSSCASVSSAIRSSSSPPGSRPVAPPTKTRSSGSASQVTGTLWIAFFANGVDAAVQTTHRRVDRLLTWQKEALDRVRTARAAGLAERLAADLIGPHRLPRPAGRPGCRASPRHTSGGDERAAPARGPGAADGTPRTGPCGL